MSSILNIATSGLISFQRSLQTISHNISNSSTEGYSRQIVDLKQMVPTFTGSGYVGNGVQVTAISRSYDDFLIKQVRNNTAAQKQSEAYATLARQVDSFIADDSINLGNVMQEFFNSIQDVATDPTSIAARQTMLGQAESMGVRFQAVSNRLDEMRDEVNGNLTNMVTQVNASAQSIAKLNEAIAAALAGGGQAPSDLLDQRDQEILELSKKVGVTVLPQDNGQVSVVIGNGQTLVDGTSYSQLKAQPNAYGESKDLDIVLVSPNGVSTTITRSITGGEIGGVLGFRDQVLDPTQNAIGRIVVGLTTDFNAQHVKGYDLNGVQGLQFFKTLPSPLVSGLPSNASTITATITDPSQLTVSDYRLDIIGGGNYQLTDVATGAVVLTGPVSNPIDLTTTTPALGLRIDVTAGALTQGDSFVIRPTRAIAGQLEVDSLITDPSMIAAAGGDATLAQPFNGVGDNSNAKALAALKDVTNLVANQASYQDAFAIAVSSLGSRTQTAKVNGEAQQRLLDHSLEAQSQVSGVNLDEEAAKLVQYQQAYQASAQVVTIAREMFADLIGAIR